MTTDAFVLVDYIIWLRMTFYKLIIIDSCYFHCGCFSFTYYTSWHSYMTPKFYKLFFFPFCFSCSWTWDEFIFSRSACWSSLHLIWLLFLLCARSSYREANQACHKQGGSTTWVIWIWLLFTSTVVSPLSSTSSIYLSSFDLWHHNQDILIGFNLVVLPMDFISSTLSSCRL